MRIFLDANIVFSAAKSDGAVRELLRDLRDKGHELWIDEYVLEEAKRNLTAKAQAEDHALEVILDDVRIAKAHPEEVSPNFSEHLPEKDRPVLAAAVRLDCEALLTGDRRHFGPLFGKTIAGVAVHSTRSLAADLLYQGRRAVGAEDAE